MTKKVVITGIGIISPAGTDLPELCQSSFSGNAETCDIHPVTSKASYPVREVTDLNPSHHGFDVKTQRIMSRDAIFAVIAARLAIKDAGLEVGKHYSPEDVGLFGATGLSGIAFEEVTQIVKHSARPDGAFDPRLFGEVALKKILPTLSFKILTNMPICFVSIFENIQGINAVYNPWEGQNARAIIAGIQAIKNGDASCALVGGCDVKTNILGLIGLKQQGLLGEEGNVVEASIPSEGASFLVLEDERKARARGARIYSRIVFSHSGTFRDDKRNIGSFMGFQEPTPPREEKYLNLTPFKENLSSQGFEAFLQGNHRVFFSTLGKDSPIVRKIFPEFSLENAVFFNPQKAIGNMFAAAASASLGLAAAFIDKQTTSDPVIVTCLGHGSEKAVFILEKETPPKSSQDDLPRQSPESTPLIATIQPAELSNPKKRIVITGLGIVSPIGNSVEEFWENLIQGKSGIGPITLFDASGLSVRIGGEVKHFDENRIRSLFPEAAHERDRKIFLGLSAAIEAMTDAGLVPARQKDPNLLETASLHIGVSLEVFFLDDVTPLVHAPDLNEALMSRFLSPSPRDRGIPTLQTPLDRLTDIIGDHFGINGSRFTICSACAAGSQIIGEALRILQHEGKEIAVVGAADSMLNPLGMGGFSLLRALSNENDRPQRACRPFDATRQGTVLGEGAAFLIMETLEHARRRGAKIYAEVLGYGSSLDAYRVSDPEPGGRGAVLAMKKALHDSGLQPHQIDCVNAHGTGTPKNDSVETMALKEVLGKRANEIPVHSVKSMTGHLIGASGAVESVAAVLSLDRQIVPPTINLLNPDPDCDLDYVTTGQRPLNARTVLSNSFGFGGQNATIIFGRMERKNKGETA